MRREPGSGGSDEGRFEAEPFVDDLPKNDRGKVDKKTLIEREKRGELGGE